eukprot:gene12292-biopygen8597
MPCDALMTPLKVGRYTMRNRVVMAPVTRCRADDEHVPTDLMVEYYGQRASMGLIVTEATQIREGVLDVCARGRDLRPEADRRVEEGDRRRARQGRPDLLPDSPRRPRDGAGELVARGDQGGVGVCGGDHPAPVRGGV